MSYKEKFTQLFSKDNTGCFLYVKFPNDTYKQYNGVYAFGKKKDGKTFNKDYDPSLNGGNVTIEIKTSKGGTGTLYLEFSHDSSDTLRAFLSDDHKSLTWHKNTATQPELTSDIYPVSQFITTVAEANNKGQALKNSSSSPTPPASPTPPENPTGDAGDGTGKEVKKSDSFTAKSESEFITEINAERQKFQLTNAVFDAISDTTYNDLSNNDKKEKLNEVIGEQPTDDDLKKYLYMIKGKEEIQGVYDTTMDGKTKVLADSDWTANTQTNRPKGINLVYLMRARYLDTKPATSNFRFV